MISNVRLIKHRPKWKCRLFGHTWEAVGKSRGDQMIYRYHICWKCMSQTRFEGFGEG